MLNDYCQTCRRNRFRIIPIDPYCANNWKGKGENLATKSLIRNQFLMACHGSRKDNSPVNIISLHQRLLLQISVPSSRTNNSFHRTPPFFYTNQFYHSSSKKGSQIPCSSLLCPLSFLSMNCQLSYFAPAIFKDGFNNGHTDKDTVSHLFYDTWFRSFYQVVRNFNVTVDCAGCIKIAVSFIRSYSSCVKPWRRCMFS